MNDLAKDPKFAKTLASMKTALAALQTSMDDPLITGKSTRKVGKKEKPGKRQKKTKKNKKNKNKAEQP